VLHKSLTMTSPIFMEIYGTLHLGEKFRSFTELYSEHDGTEQLCFDVVGPAPQQLLNSVKWCKMTLIGGWCCHVTRCVYDYVELRDGGSMSAPRIGRRFCGRTQPTGGFSTTGQAMFVRFRTDSSVTRRGFKASVSYCKFL